MPEPAPFPALDGPGEGAGEPLDGRPLTTLAASCAGEGRPL